MSSGGGLGTPRRLCRPAASTRRAGGPRARLKMCILQSDQECLVRATWGWRQVLRLASSPACLFPDIPGRNAGYGSQSPATAAPRSNREAGRTRKRTSAKPTASHRTRRSTPALRTGLAAMHKVRAMMLEPNWLRILHLVIAIRLVEETRQQITINKPAPQTVSKSIFLGWLRASLVRLNYPSTCAGHQPAPPRALQTNSKQWSGKGSPKGEPQQKEREPLSGNPPAPQGKTIRFIFEQLPPTGTNGCETARASPFSLIN